MKSTKKPAEEPKLEIGSINQMIHEAYSSLEKKYSESNNAREGELLKNYINVLDRVADEIIYAQEKFLSIDTERIKDDKCINYATEIAAYRQECFELKSKLKKINFKLRTEQAKREKLKHQNQNLRQLCSKKITSVEKYRKFISLPKSPRKQKSAQKNPENTTLNLEFKLKTSAVKVNEVKGNFGSEKKMLPESWKQTETRHSTFRDRFYQRKLPYLVGEELEI